MRIGKCIVSNFGSYANFAFDYSTPGLSLAYGATGSGKSTIPDVCTWLLFGVTAKDGNADDIRSWQAPNAPTSGTLEVYLPTGDITITRVRGKQNDLYFKTEAGETIRGKDLAETQKKLNAHLGFDADTYIASAYFHEFNPTGAFFIAKAKDRRNLFERLANLELPRRLAESTSHEKKQTKSEIEEIKLNLSRTAGKIDQVTSALQRAKNQSDDWVQGREAALESIEALLLSFESDKQRKITDLATKCSSFETSRNTKVDDIIEKLEGLDRDIRDDSYFTAQVIAIRATQAETKAQADICPTCGTALGDCEDTSFQDALELIKEQKNHNQTLKLRHSYDIKELKRLQGEVNPYGTQMNAELARSNPYYDQLESEKTRINPYEEQITKDATLLINISDDKDRLTLELGTLEARLSDLSFLYDISANLRGELLKQAVRSIEAHTNETLETHFDAEIRCSFVLDGADSLDVTIHKSGHECSYKQLSKGQRGLLKLAFTTSVMEASANKAGVHFSNLFFDEALSGLDAQLCVKAFALLQELSLEHESILVIDHDLTFQSLFDRKFKVTMTDDISRIHEES